VIGDDRNECFRDNYDDGSDNCVGDDNDGNLNSIMISLYRYVVLVICGYWFFSIFRHKLDNKAEEQPYKVKTVSDLLNTLQI